MLEYIINKCELINKNNQKFRVQLILKNNPPRSLCSYFKFVFIMPYTDGAKTLLKRDSQNIYNEILREMIKGEVQILKSCNIQVYLEPAFGTQSLVRNTIFHIFGLPKNL